MAANKNLLALDVGEKRIGVALADTSVRIAVPYDTVEVNGNEVITITELILHEKIDTVVVGYPRNQAGLATAQTAYVEQFAEQFADIDAEITFQDESLTSVIAEDQLKQHKRPYTKADIDAQAAAIILQDYLEERYGS
jgi:putative Holliday junction resolvase